jgi:hypothetical protein
MTRGAAVFVTLAALALALPPVAARATSAPGKPAAAPPAAVQVIPPMCPVAPLSLPAFLDSLRVELAGGSTRCCDAGGGEPDAATVRVALAVEPCDAAAGRVIVTADQARAGRSIRREIGLEDVAAGARPRALALAVAELVRSIDAPASAPAPAPAAASAPAPPLAIAARPDGGDGGARPAIGAAADVELRIYPGRGTALWGGRLSLTAAGTRWQAALGVDAAAGDQHTQIGSVSIKTLALSAGGGPRFDLGNGTLALGLGAEVGWGWIAGAPELEGVRGSTGSGPTAALRALLAFEVRAARSVALRAAIEGGYTVLGVNAFADRTPAGGISGPSVIAAGGVGWAGGP